MELEQFRFEPTSDVTVKHFDSILSFVQHVLYLDYSLDDFKINLKNDKDFFEDVFALNSLFLNKNINEISRAEKTHIGEANWWRLFDMKDCEFDVSVRNYIDLDESELVREFTAYEFTINNTKFIYTDWDC